MPCTPVKFTSSKSFAACDCYFEKNKTLLKHGRGTHLLADSDMDITKSSGYRDYEWAVSLNRVCLTFLGIWPKKNESEREKKLLDVYVIAILNLAIWSSALPSIHSLIRVWGDLMSTIDNLQYTLPLSIGLFKQTIMWQKKKEIIPLLRMLKEDWMKSKTEQERDVMIKTARFARAFTMFEYFLMLLSFIMVVILPYFGYATRYITNITESSKRMPLQSYYIYYNQTESPFYEITYSLQGISLTMVAGMYSCSDCFFGLLVFHVCGQLENLSARIKDLDKFNNFNEGLSYSLREHCRLIRSINNIDNVFNLMLLVSLFYFATLFAFYGFFIVNMASQGRDISIGRLVFIILIFCTTFTHTCLYCLVGELLITKCDSIYRATCEYKWYMLKPKKAKIFLMIMIRSNKSPYLTAGKLLPVTMATLCNLLKTSGGYVSVLLAQRQ